MTEKETEGWITVIDILETRTRPWPHRSRYRLLYRPSDHEPDGVDRLLTQINNSWFEV